MKKAIRILFVCTLILGLFLASACADEFPQPEGGMKFEGNWAMMNGLIEIVYEEEGYRVSVDLFQQDDNTGTLWEYSCLYNEETDSLLSLSSSKTAYTMDLHTLDRTFGECAYEGLDVDNNGSSFALTESGSLEWKDGHENIGQDLEFTPIGRFEGVWRNDEEDIYTEFHWQGLLDENQFFYSIFVGQGDENLHLAGMYNPDSQKLECYDTDIIPIESMEDFFLAQDAEKPYHAVFTDAGNAQIQFASEKGTYTLEYDLLGPVS